MNITYRQATINDLKELCEIRKIQLIHEGIEPSINIDQDLTRFFQDTLTSKNLYQILAYNNEQIIATGAVCFYDYPPTFTNQTGRIAYITNMYTDPLYRKKGIASQILQLLEDETKKRHVSVMRLGASVLGRPVYERFGFQQDHIWLSKKIDIQDE